MYAYQTNRWSICIVVDCHPVEVFYLAFPRLIGYRLSTSCQERLTAALKTANEICSRFIADGRLNPTDKELQKAFDRTHVE